jgi:glycosyltransferase involved in cell wall biosynthesis
VPVVSTDISGIPELVDDQVNGLLAPPGDEKALAYSKAFILLQAYLLCPTTCH